MEMNVSCLSCAHWRVCQIRDVIRTKVIKRGENLEEVAKREAENCEFFESLSKRG